MDRPERILAPDGPRHTPLYGWLARRMARWDRDDEARRRRGIGAVWATCAMLLLACAVLLFGPIINAPTSLDEVLDSTREAGRDRWIARESTFDMRLDRTSSGALRAEVTESFTALFPDDVDDSGIERVVLAELEGHDLHPTLVSAAIDGEPVEPRQSESATRVTWRLDAGERLRGDHEFSLVYTLEDLAYAHTDDSSGRDAERLYWDAFGPEFEQGSAATAFSITMPAALADELVSDPRGSVAWTIIASSEILAPEDAGDGLVRFEVTNSQTLPPYALMSIDAQFEPGTFAMPRPTALFWIMLVGPFLPLVLGGVLLACSLAGRAVLWSDADGEPWIVTRFRPPKNVTPEVAARVSRARRTVRLVDLLARYQRERSAENERRLAREARLVASPGLSIARPSGYLTARAWRAQFGGGLRRRASGVPKHVLLALAVVLVTGQLALARQLAGHERIGLEWWPMLASILLAALAIVSCAVVLTAAPLTERGAKLRDFAAGIRLYDESANVGELADLMDPLLPYAIMFRSRREAASVAQRALAEGGIAPDRTPRGLPLLRATVRIVPALAVAAAIVVASVFPGPTSDAPGSAVYDLDPPGDYGVSVQRFDARAVLAAVDGEPRLEVTETLDVTVLDAGTIPQVFRDWHDHVDGHDTRLAVTEVRVDGEPVPFEQARVAAPRTQTDHAMMRTRLDAAWPGEHRVEVDYEILSPVATVKTADGWQQRIRWAAVAPGWEWDWDAYDTPLESASASLTVDEAVASRALGDATGWEIDRRRGGDGEAEATRSGDAFTLVLAAPGEYGVETDYEHSDAGLQLTFDEGEFAAAGTRAEWRSMRVLETLPTWIQYVFAIPALVAAAMGLWRRPRRGVAREAVSLVAIGFTIASIVTWVWGSVEAHGDEPWFLVPGTLLVANIGLAISVNIVVWRREAPAASAR